MKWSFVFGLLAFACKCVLAQELSIDGTATIKLTSRDLDTGVPVSVSTLHSFPAYGHYEKEDTLWTNGKTLTLTIPIHTVQQAILTVGSRRLNVLIAPLDTISVKVGGAAAEYTLDIEGLDKQVQDYYLAKAARYQTSTGQQLMNLGLSNTGLNQVKVFADSLLTSEIAFFNKNADDLPQWFKRYETDAIRYSNAYLRLYLFHYKRDVLRQSVSPTDGYFDFLERMPIRNTSALYDYDYLFFLREYCRYKLANDSLRELPRNSVVQQHRTNVGLLGERIGDFFTLYTISEALNDRPRQVLEDIGRLSVPESYAAVISYLRNCATQRLNILKTGSGRPDFSLSDIQDSPVSLSAFRGKVVYLSFWFAGCKGCIEEFSHENKLVERFKGEPVQIVSICTRTSKEMWLEKINRHRLETLNLYADAHQGKALEKAFGISVYPQYVLVDRNGVVVENYTDRPSNGAYEKILKVLSHNGK